MENSKLLDVPSLLRDANVKLLDIDLVLLDVHMKLLDVHREFLDVNLNLLDMHFQTQPSEGSWAFLDCQFMVTRDMYFDKRP